VRRKWAIEVAVPQTSKIIKLVHNLERGLTDWIGGTTHEVNLWCTLTLSITSAGSVLKYIAPVSKKIMLVNKVNGTIINRVKNDGAFQFTEYSGNNEGIATIHLAFRFGNCYFSYWYNSAHVLRGLAYGVMVGVARPTGVKLPQSSEWKGLLLNPRGTFVTTKLIVIDQTANDSRKIRVVTSDPGLSFMMTGRNEERSTTVKIDGNLLHFKSDTTGNNWLSWQSMRLEIYEDLLVGFVEYAEQNAAMSYARPNPTHCQNLLYLRRYK